MTRCSFPLLSNQYPSLRDCSNVKVADDDPLMDFARYHEVMDEAAHEVLIELFKSMWTPDDNRFTSGFMGRNW
jgi:hypothetical protein